MPRRSSSGILHRSEHGDPPEVQVASFSMVAACFAGCLRPAIRRSSAPTTAATIEAASVPIFASSCRLGESKARLVNPANRKKLHIIVVGTGLAGASCAASLAEQGYQVSTFCFQDSPRRAHSVAAQGGVNAARNYKNDGDSVWRMFHARL